MRQTRTAWPACPPSQSFSRVPTAACSCPFAPFFQGLFARWAHFAPCRHCKVHEPPSVWNASLLSISLSLSHPPLFFFFFQNSVPPRLRRSQRFGSISPDHACNAVHNQCKEGVFQGAAPKARKCSSQLRKKILGKKYSREAHNWNLMGDIQIRRKNKLLAIAPSRVTYQWPSSENHRSAMPVPTSTTVRPAGTAPRFDIAAPGGRTTHPSGGTCRSSAYCAATTSRSPVLSAL